MSEFARKGMEIIARLNASEDTNERLMLQQQLKDYILPPRLKGGR